uniref:HTH araC/xylS-type domain-containing protein n=1 Tax=Chromera velia CCMP2878 TaxID=1169474 RepID=A0A0G4F614_9ALVE|eukprot:Cvel_15365.t1-p1 / transcript=Cvel_15365.t1 / gene=Cvel_15365 / organism=Chromera_velia_CCMP2878 / gene_product=Sushi, von Willebrand factor type A, EGF and, putative / transcript_product=Sushi, von Willebrand factor type A, EGF and, putative / location=Cvel_scaffold1132:25633-36449(+) / protein_length=2468 / sequence_SO=supercontig / SO=protein_coding / is_pseudo=false
MKSSVPMDLLFRLSMVFLSLSFLGGLMRTDAYLLPLHDTFYFSRTVTTPGSYPDFKIGFVCPLTGSRSTIGQKMYRGLLLWVDYVNNSEQKLVVNENNYYTVSPIYSDSTSDTTTAQTVTNTMIGTNKVNVVVSCAAEEVTNVATEASGSSIVSMHILGSSDSSLWSSSSNTFAFGASPPNLDTFHSLLTDAQTQGYSKLALLYASDKTSSTDLCTNAKEFAEWSLSMTTAATGTYTGTSYSTSTSASAISSLLQSAQSNSAEILLVCNSDDAAGADSVDIVNAMQTLGYDFKAVAFAYNTVSFPLTSSVSNSTAASAIAATRWDPLSRGSFDFVFGSSSGFVTAFKNMYGTDPDEYEAAAVGAMNALMFGLFKTTSWDTTTDESTRNFASNSALLVTSLGSMREASFYGTLAFGRDGVNNGRTYWHLQQYALDGTRTTVLPEEAAPSGISPSFPAISWEARTGQGCYPGTYFNGTSCVNCPAHQYSNSYGATACSDCPVGQEQASEGQTSCKECQKGFVKGSASGSACSSCGAGTFSQTTGAASCSSCPAGSYQPDVGATNCIPCPAGRAQSETGQSFCAQCADGFFASGEGSVSCFECPRGASCSNATEQVTPVATQGYYMILGLKADEFTVPNVTERRRRRRMDAIEARRMDSTEASIAGGEGVSYLFRCSRPDDCVGANQCIDGANSNSLLCRRCVSTSFRTSAITPCRACPPIWGVALQLLGCLLVMAFLVWLLTSLSRVLFLATGPTTLSAMSPFRDAQWVKPKWSLEHGRGWEEAGDGSGVDNDEGLYAYDFLLASQHPVLLPSLRVLVNWWEMTTVAMAVLAEVALQSTDAAVQVEAATRSFIYGFAEFLVLLNPFRTVFLLDCLIGDGSAYPPSFIYTVMATCVPAVIAAVCWAFLFVSWRKSAKSDRTEKLPKVRMVKQKGAGGALQKAPGAGSRRSPGHQRGRSAPAPAQKEEEIEEIPVYADPYTLTQLPPGPPPGSAQNMSRSMFSGHNTAQSLADRLKSNAAFQRDKADPRASQGGAEEDMPRLFSPPPLTQTQAGIRPSSPGTLMRRRSLVAAAAGDTNKTEADRHISGKTSRHFCAFCVVLFYLWHPSLVSYLFEVQQCEFLDAWRLRSFPAVICYENSVGEDGRRYDHFGIRAGSIVGLTLWGFLLPVSLGTVLYFWGQRREFRFSKDFLGVFSFFTVGYRAQTLGWEAWVMVRRAALLCMPVWLGISTRLNLYVLLSALFLVVHLIWRPHTLAFNRMAGFLEAVSLGSVFLTFLTARFIHVLFLNSDPVFHQTLALSPLERYAYQDATTKVFVAILCAVALGVQFYFGLMLLYTAVVCNDRSVAIRTNSKILKNKRVRAVVERTFPPNNLVFLNPDGSLDIHRLSAQERKFLSAVLGQMLQEAMDVSEKQGIKTKNQRRVRHSRRETSEQGGDLQSSGRLGGTWGGGMRKKKATNLAAVETLHWMMRPDFASDLEHEKKKREREDEETRFMQARRASLAAPPDILKGTLGVSGFDEKNREVLSQEQAVKARRTFYLEVVREAIEFAFEEKQRCFFALLSGTEFRDPSHFLTLTRWMKQRALKKRSFHFNDDDEADRNAAFVAANPWTVTSPFDAEYEKLRGSEEGTRLAERRVALRGKLTIGCTVEEIEFALRAQEPRLRHLLATLGILARGPEDMFPLHNTQPSRGGTRGFRSMTNLTESRRGLEKEKTRMLMESFSQFPPPEAVGLAGANRRGSMTKSIFEQTAGPLPDEGTEPDDNIQPVAATTAAARSMREVATPASSLPPEQADLDTFQGFPPTTHPPPDDPFPPAPPEAPGPNDSGAFFADEGERGAFQSVGMHERALSLSLSASGVSSLPYTREMSELSRTHSREEPPDGPAPPAPGVSVKYSIPEAHILSLSPSGSRKVSMLPVETRHHEEMGEETLPPGAVPLSEEKCPPLPCHFIRSDPKSRLPPIVEEGRVEALATETPLPVGGTRLLPPPGSSQSRLNVPRGKTINPSQRAAQKESAGPKRPPAAPLSSTVQQSQTSRIQHPRPRDRNASERLPSNEGPSKDRNANSLGSPTFMTPSQPRDTSPPLPPSRLPPSLLSGIHHNQPAAPPLIVKPPPPFRRVSAVETSPLALAEERAPKPPTTETAPAPAPPESEPTAFLIMRGASTQPLNCFPESRASVGSSEGTPNGNRKTTVRIVDKNSDARLSGDPPVFDVNGREPSGDWSLQEHFSATESWNLQHNRGVAPSVCGCCRARAGLSPTSCVLMPGQGRGGGSPVLNQGSQQNPAGGLQGGRKKTSFDLAYEPKRTTAAGHFRPVHESEEPPQGARSRPRREESVRGDSRRGDSVRGDSRRGDSVRGYSRREESLRGDSRRGDSVSGDSRRGDSVRSHSREDVIDSRGDRMSLLSHSSQQLPPPSRSREGQMLESRMTVGRSTRQSETGRGSVTATLTETSSYSQVTTSNERRLSSLRENAPPFTGFR